MVDKSQINPQESIINMTVEDVIGCLALLPQDAECVIINVSYPDTEFVKITRFEVGNIIIGSDEDTPRIKSVILKA